MTTEALREIIRRRYAGRCGSCSVHEFEAGTELEIDHFQPRSAAGSDDPDNLVYCCTACNRHKGDFWPEGDPHTTVHRLLHPLRDDLTSHLREDPDHRMVPSTETGAFHLERLHLNRPPLVALRRMRTETERLKDDLAAAQAAQDEFRERLDLLERDLQNVLAQVARISEQ